MPIDIRGRLYWQVAERVARFREEFQAQYGWAILTKADYTENGVRVVAEIVAPDGNVVATGHAERTHDEAKKLGGRTLEFAETGAVGRALYFFGVRFEGEKDVASADDLEFVETETLSIETDYMPGILAAIKAEDGPGLRQLWDELDERGKGIVWRLMDSHKKGRVRTLLAATYEGQSDGLTEGT